MQDKTFYPFSHLQFINVCGLRPIPGWYFLPGLIRIRGVLVSIMGEVGQVINQNRVTTDYFHGPGLSGFDIEGSGDAEDMAHVLGTNVTA